MEGTLWIFQVSGSLQNNLYYRAAVKTFDPTPVQTTFFSKSVYKLIIVLEISGKEISKG